MEVGPAMVSHHPVPVRPARGERGDRVGLPVGLDDDGHVRCRDPERIDQQAAQPTCLRDRIKPIPALPPLAPILGRIGEVLGWLDETVVSEPEEIGIEIEEAARPPESVSPEPPPAPSTPPPLTPAAPWRRPLRPITTGAGEVVVAPAGVTYWGTAGLELVRFAGSNRLMVEFSYHGKPRTVEPYSLHRAGTGNLLLYAWETASSQIKAFKVAEMIGLRVSALTFVPRYAVDLTGISEAAPRAPKPRRSGRPTRRRR